MDQEGLRCLNIPMFWENNGPRLRRFAYGILFTSCIFQCAMGTNLFDRKVFAMEKPKHIVLLGASVGKAWNIESLPKRLSQSNPKSPSSPTSPSNPTNPRFSVVDPNNSPSASRLAVFPYRFEYVGEYQFDKSKVLQQILERKENKPEAIIIKECAAYFPGDFSNYQALMKKWIKQCKQSAVIPIPATVVPVIKDDSMKTRVKDMIKRILGRSTSDQRLMSILQYNDWIKSYAQEESLVVLDLEAALRTSKEDRSLRLDLHAGDGLHLNEKAYRLLDPFILSALGDLFGRER